MFWPHMALMAYFHGKFESASLKRKNVKRKRTKLERKKSSFPENFLITQHLLFFISLSRICFSCSFSNKTTAMFSVCVLIDLDYLLTIHHEFSFFKYASFRLLVRFSNIVCVLRKKIFSLATPMIFLKEKLVIFVLGQHSQF